jgi:hypothetical protein
VRKWLALMDPSDGCVNGQIVLSTETSLRIPHFILLDLLCVDGGSAVKSSSLLLTSPISYFAKCMRVEGVSTPNWHVRTPVSKTLAGKHRKLHESSKRELRQWRIVAGGFDRAVRPLASVTVHRASGLAIQ